jgi:hypothetical protein
MKCRLAGFLSLAIAALCRPQPLLAADSADKDLSKAKNVCDYVAQAYNQGKMESISVPEGVATSDGLTVHFSVGWDQGSCPMPDIKVKEVEDNKIPENTALRE